MRKRYSEQGNVLFLILIAVALFAALSYAVTQSTRGGGSNIEDEKRLLTGTTIVDYFTTLQAAFMRMKINGIDPASIEFDAPSSAGYGDNPNFEIFHPLGGGAVYQPPSVFNGSMNVLWGGVSIQDVGTASPEITYTLQGLSQAQCQEINEGLGLSGVVTNSGGGFVVNSYPGSYSACFDNYGITNIYYHVMDVR